MRGRRIVFWHSVSYRRKRSGNWVRRLQLSSDLPVQVIEILAHRSQRFQRYLWHRVREGWSHLTAIERQAVYRINPLWVPPRPAVDSHNRPNRDNGSGEDFLFMVHGMTALLNDLLLMTPSSEMRVLEGWRHLPDPSNREYPVPKFQGSGLEELKTPEYYEQHLAPWERELTRPGYLRNVNLGQLGSDIEFAIYRNAHLRWATASAVGYRPTTEIVHCIGEQWDSPAYNYLGDTYSSLVNPIFWKLIGWVNDRVEDWKRAHALALIVWRHTWMGDFKQPSVVNGQDAEMYNGAVDKELSSIDQILWEASTNNLDGFYRPHRFARLVDQDLD